MTSEEFAKEVMGMINHLYDRVKALERKVHELPDNIEVDDE
jgi:hypothetical protein